jgi:hypothetical protein
VVRDTLLKCGIRPESLPVAEDVKKVERRLASDEKKSLKNPDTIFLLVFETNLVLRDRPTAEASGSGGVVWGSAIDL